MREVLFVKKEDRAKAEDLLKKDDIVSRQSIAVRECSALGFKEEGYLIILEGGEEALKRAEGLVKELAERYKHAKDALKRYDEMEESAAEGLGMLWG